MRRTIGSSALRMAVPSDGSASSSSPLAASIAASDPMRDRWTAWTAVTIPMDGRAMRARSAISPPTYMPISRTAASCSGPRSSTVSGRPTSLLRLPSVRSVVNRRATTAATASLVEVLAMLPVIPITMGSNRRRQPAATAPRAARASGTRMIVTSASASGSGIGRVTRTAAAPGRSRRPRGHGRPSAHRAARRTDVPASRAVSRPRRHGSAAPSAPPAVPRSGRAGRPR